MCNKLAYIIVKEWIIPDITIFQLMFKCGNYLILGLFIGMPHLTE